MLHHPKEPSHRVFWKCLGVVCDLLFTKQSDALKMRDWLTKRGRTAWIVSL